MKNGTVISGCYDPATGKLKGEGVMKVPGAHSTTYTAEWDEATGMIQGPAHIINDMGHVFEGKLVDNVRHG